MHAPPDPLVPDRRVVDGPDPFVRDVETRALLHRVERVHPSRPVLRAAVEPREVLVHVVKPFTHLGNDGVPVEEPFEGGESPREAAVDRVEERVGIEPLVAADLAQELDVVPDAQAVVHIPRMTCRGEPAVSRYVPT